MPSSLALCAALLLVLRWSRSHRAALSCPSSRLQASRPAPATSEAALNHLAAASPLLMAAPAGTPASASGSGSFFPAGTPIAASSSSGVVSSAPSLLDKPISRGTGQVSLSAFSYLFCELVSYCQARMDGVADLEKRMSDLGYGIGLRSLELLTYRSSIQAFLLTTPQGSNTSGGGSQPVQSPISLHNVASLNGRKEKNLVSMLQFLHGSMWKSLFGHVADGLEKATEKEDEYYIYDRDPITNRFIGTSVPKEFQHFNCAAFIAGIVNGILDGAEFRAEVSAHFNTTAQGITRTVYVIKFEKESTKREG